MARMGENCNCEEMQVADSTTTYKNLHPVLQRELQRIVKALNSPGKGILAIDESSSSLDEKFREIGMNNSEIDRRDFRQMLLSSDKYQLSRYISGVILNHETLYQKTAKGQELMDFLRERNLIPGVKVDKGTVFLFGTECENTTEGLDSLQERCIRYKKDGCHFVKWRCTYKMTHKLPSKLAIRENANVLARYAAIAQSARMVPIIEPEILTIDEHDMARALEVHQEVLSVLFHTLKEHHVFLEGMILKTAMVVAGFQHAKFCKPQMVADFTLAALRRTVPPAVPLIMFLSGGQSDEDATINLNAINHAGVKVPWDLSFCYGRALHATAMKTWKGQPENWAKARFVFLERLKQCSDASQGKLDVEEFKMVTRPPDDDD